MITIALKFFDKKTEFLKKEFKIQVPSQMVFDIAKSDDLDVIHVYGFDVTPEMIHYVKKNYTDIAENFKKFDAQFTGAEGLD